MTLIKDKAAALIFCIIVATLAVIFAMAVDPIITTIIVIIALLVVGIYFMLWLFFRAFIWEM